MGTHVQHDHLDYSTSEHLIGEEWIDGKTVYRKVVEFGVLPNATTKNVAHGISNLDIVISLEGIAYNSIIGNYLPLTWVSTAGTLRAELLIQGSDIRIVTSSDMTQWTQTHIIIEYTKTV